MLQAILTADASGNSFVIFQYTMITWTTGDGEGGSAGLDGFPAQVCGAPELTLHFWG